MPSITVYAASNPAGAWEQSEPSIVGAAATLWEAINAEDESSALEFSAVTNQCNEAFLFDLSSLPSGAIVTSVQLTFRHLRDSNHGLIRIRSIGFNDDGDLIYGENETHQSASWGATTTVSLPARYALGDGSAWTTAADIGFIINHDWGSSGDGPHYLYWVRAVIEYDASSPVAEVTAPAGIVEAPDAVAWTYSQPDGRPQTHYDARVYAEGDTGATYDPDTGSATAVTSTGKTSGASTRSAAIGTALPAGTYRAFVKVWSTTSAGDPTVSAWASSTFEIEAAAAPDPEDPDAIYPPETPGAVVPTFDADTGAVTVRVYGDGHQAGYEAGLAILDDADTWWVDAADLDPGATVWEPRNPGATVDPDDTTERALDLGADGWAQIEGSVPELTIAEGSVLEVDHVVTDWSRDGARIIWLGDTSVSEPRIAVFQDDNSSGRYYIAVSDNAGNAAYPGWLNLAALYPEDTRVTARFTFGASTINLEISDDGGETFVDLGASSTMSPNVLPITLADSESAPSPRYRIGDPDPSISLGKPIYRVTLDDVDLFNAELGEPGSPLAGSGIDGAVWVLEDDAAITGAAEGRAIVSATKRPYDGIAYGWFPGADSQGAANDNYAEADSGSRLDSSVNEVRFVGRFQRIEDTRQAAIGMASGRGRFYMLSGGFLAASIRTTSASSRSGTTTVAVPGLTTGDWVWVDASYDGASGDWLFRYSFDDVEDPDDVVAWVDLETIAAGADTLNSLVDTTSIYFGITNPAGDVGQEVRLRYAAAWQGGLPVAEFWPDRDIDTAANGASDGQDLIAGEVTDTQISRTATAPRTAIVTGPRVTLDGSTPSAIALPASLSPDALDSGGFTIVLGRWMAYADDVLQRLISAEPSSGDGFRLDIRADQLLRANADVDVFGQLAYASLVVDTIAATLDGTTGTLSTVTLGADAPGDTSSLTPSGPIIVGARGYDRAIEASGELGSIAVIPRKLTDQEVADVADAMHYLSISDLVGDFVSVQRSTAGSPFEAVETLAPVARFGAAAAVDYRAPFHALSVYRARLERDGVPPSAWVQSDPVSTDSDRWWLIDPDTGDAVNPTVAGYQITERRRSGLTASPGAVPIASHSGPLAKHITVTIRTMNRAEREALESMLDRRTPIRLVDILGREWSTVPGSDIDTQMVRARPTNTETTGLRDMHEISLTFVESGA